MKGTFDCARSVLGLVVCDFRAVITGGIRTEDAHPLPRRELDVEEVVDNGPNKALL